MSVVAPMNPTRRSRANGGFTLVELVAVMILTAILAATAIPALASLTNTRQAAAARELSRGLAQMRQRALATGTAIWVVFDVDAETWSVLEEDPLNPGRIGATPTIDAATGAPLIVRLNEGALAEASIISVDFDSAAEVGFDWLGRPLNATEAPLAAVGEIQLSGGHIVRVEPDTGHVTHVAP